MECRATTSSGGLSWHAAGAGGGGRLQGIGRAKECRGASNEAQARLAGLLSGDARVPRHHPLITSTAEAPVVIARQERRAVAKLFMVAGGVVGVLAPLVPFFAEALKLSPGALGVLFGVVAAGAGSSMLALARYHAALSARQLSSFFGGGLLVVLPLLPFASGYIALLLLGFAAGVAYGGVDWVMNVAAGFIEIRHQRPVMSGMHGCFSAGVALAAGAMSLLLAIGASPGVCAACICAVQFLVLALAQSGLTAVELKEQVPSEPQSGHSHDLALWSVVLVAILAMILEGALENWMVLFLVQSGNGATMATVVFTLYSACFAAARFAGNWLVARWGPGVLLRVSGIVVAFSLFGAVRSAHGGAAYVGFMLTGLAMGNISPLLFSAAARIARGGVAQGIAAVALGGYVALLAGPMLVGLVAAWVGLGPVLSALALVGLVCCGQSLREGRAVRSGANAKGGY